MPYGIVRCQCAKCGKYFAQDERKYIPRTLEDQLYGIRHDHYCKDCGGDGDLNDDTRYEANGTPKKTTKSKTGK